MGLKSKHIPPRRRARQGSPGPEEQHRQPAFTTRYTYRRNRTLTGSLVNHVSSAGELQAQLKSPRVHVHDLRRTRRHLLAMIGGTVWGIVAVGLLLYNITVTPVVTGNFDSNQQLYQAKITEYFAAHPLERFRFAFNAERLTRHLQVNGCPEVAEVLATTQQTGLGKTTFTLAMRQAAVVWTINDQQLFVDTEGNAFRRAYGSKPTIEIVDESGISARDNQILASNQFLGFIGKVVGAMRRYELTVQKITLPANTTRQIYVWISGVEYPVKLSVDRSAILQSEDTARAVSYLSKHNIKPEYLDVRVSGRAVYR